MKNIVFIKNRTTIALTLRVRSGGRYDSVVGGTLKRNTLFKKSLFGKLSNSIAKTTHIVMVIEKKKRVLSDRTSVSFN